MAMEGLLTEPGPVFKIVPELSHPAFVAWAFDGIEIIVKKNEPIMTRAMTLVTFHLVLMFSK
jgi:hypothetical protein